MSNVQPLRYTPDLIGVFPVSAGSDAEYIDKELREGVSHAYVIAECYVILRKEIHPHGKELVVVCVEGSNVYKCFDIIYAEAQKKGYDSIRYHATRKAFARLGQRYKFNELPERVYRTRLTGDLH